MSGLQNWSGRDKLGYIEQAGVGASELGVLAVVSDYFEALDESRTKAPIYAKKDLTKMGLSIWGQRVSSVRILAWLFHSHPKRIALVIAVISLTMFFERSRGRG